MRSNTSTTSRLVKGGGFALGVVAVVLVLVAWRVPRGDGHAGSDVVVVSQPIGELAVLPTGAFISTTNLEPGNSSSGSFAIENQTGKALRVSLHALPDQPDLDGLLHVRVSSRSRLLYAGTLGGLRRWTRTQLVLPVRGHAPLSFRISLPEGIGRAYEGQVETVPIELRARVVGRAHA
jgi:hypothetical protein